MRELKSKKWERGNLLSLPRLLAEHTSQFNNRLSLKNTTDPFDIRTSPKPLPSGMSTIWLNCADFFQKWDSFKDLLKPCIESNSKRCNHMLINTISTNYYFPAINQ